MANVVKFDMKKVPAALSEMYVRVTDLDRNELFAGVKPISGTEIELDLGSVGAVGQGVLVQGDNFLKGSNESSFKSFSGYSLIELLGASNPTISGFNLDKLVVLGASIANNSFSNESIRDFLSSYVLTKYNKSIEIVEEAVTGRTVAGMSSAIELLITKYSSEPNTHFLMHIGGNDIVVGTPFLDLPADTQVQLKASLSNIYDKVHAAGKKLIQTSITYRNYSVDGLEIIDLDGAEIKDRELLGSYTYTRDWVVPVMAEKCPEYLRDGWPVIDAYNATRNVYDRWANGDDVVHPNTWAKSVFSLTVTEGMVQLSLGVVPEKILVRNFSNNATSDTSLPVHTFGFGASEIVGSTDDGICWFSHSASDIAQPLNVMLEKDGVKLYTYFEKMVVGSAGNVSDPSNSSNTLNNNVLLSSTASINAGPWVVIYIAIEGLSPLTEYTLSAVSSAKAGEAADSIAMYLNTGESDQVQSTINSPEGNIRSRNAVSDSSGRLVIIAEERGSENIPYINGVSVQAVV